MFVRAECETQSVHMGTNAHFVLTELARTHSAATVRVDQLGYTRTTSFSGND